MHREQIFKIYLHCLLNFCILRQDIFQNLLLVIKQILNTNICEIRTKNSVRFHVQSLPISRDMYFTPHSTSRCYARNRILRRAYSRMKSEALGHVMAILVGLGTNFL